MKGKCKYCDKTLIDKANIRCDNCDNAFSDGMDLGEKFIRGKISEAIKLLLSLAK